MKKPSKPATPRQARRYPRPKNRPTISYPHYDHEGRSVDAPEKFRWLLPVTGDAEKREHRRIELQKVLGTVLARCRTQPEVDKVFGQLFDVIATAVNVFGITDRWIRDERQRVRRQQVGLQGFHRFLRRARAFAWLMKSLPAFAALHAEHPSLTPEDIPQIEAALTLLKEKLAPLVERPIPPREQMPRPPEKRMHLKRVRDALLKAGGGTVRPGDADTLLRLFGLQGRSA